MVLEVGLEMENVPLWIGGGRGEIGDRSANQGRAAARGTETFLGVLA